ncbi:MAG: BlaI/MecI/CopY family transcriptional regulator [Spirochaetales bacterium]|nr:BlaI/MecI/CopY family transcriptional regulator [Spirochaetales bacterium]
MKYNFISTEFDILKILWKHGQLSSKEIHEEISLKTGWAYSTTRTVIERMVKKEYLLKNSFHGINIYSAKVSKVHAFASQISQFADKILERDAFSLLPLFVKSDALSDDELKELKDYLKSMESNE